VEADGAGLAVPPVTGWKGAGSALPGRNAGDTRHGDDDNDAQHAEGDHKALAAARD
jgi:hypothetical protein